MFADRLESRWFEVVQEKRVQEWEVLLVAPLVLPLDLGPQLGPEANELLPAPPPPLVAEPGDPPLLMGPLPVVELVDPPLFGVVEAPLVVLVESPPLVELVGAQPLLVEVGREGLVLGIRIQQGEELSQQELGLLVWACRLLVLV